MWRFLLFLLLHLCCNLHAQQWISPAAVTDLRNWNVEGKRIFSLEGKWEFYWKKFLNPSDFRSDKVLKPDLLVKSGSWNDLEINNKKLGGEGYATYRMVLKNLPAKTLMLDVYSVQTSCRVFINDSLMLEIGKPGTSKESTAPMTRDAQLNIPGNTRNAEIIVQIANFHHRKGGFVHPFEIGLSQRIIRHHMLNYMLQIVESSALFIIGLFLLALYIFRRKDLSILYFSLFCITLAFRPIIAVNYLVATLFNGINWNMMVKMEYLAVLFPCLFMLLFIRQLFPDQLPGLFTKILSVILVIKVIITLFFPPSVFSWLIPPLLVIISIGVIVFATTIVRAVMAKVEGARYAGMGLIILLCSLLLKILVYASIIPPVHILITALDIGFIFMMSLILGARFSLQFVKVERLQQITEIQRRDIEQKKAAIEEKNKSIIDSINYAQRIQASLLPSERYFQKYMDKLRGK
jgi:hypothetical protein